MAEKGQAFMELYYALLCFYVYGFLGWCAEVAFAAVKQRKFVNRGFLNGPICPIYGIGVVSVAEILQPIVDRIVLLYICSAVIVTILEWLTGFLMEKLFHHKWWDYSNMPLNINGYVCVLFSIIWGAVCVIIIRHIHPAVYYVLTKLPFWLGIFGLLLLTAVLAADVYVTVTGTFKLNRRLEKMESIADELKSLSEQIGSNISKNVLDGLNKQEDTRQKVEDTLERLRDETEEKKEYAEAFREEQRVKVAALKAKYRELAEGQSKVGRRIIKAFPHMQSRSHEKQFRELKESLLKIKHGKNEKD